MGEEVLYRSERTLVFRRDSTDGRGNGGRGNGGHGGDGHGTVIVKRATGAGAMRRIDHERAVLRRLGQAPGVPRMGPHQPRHLLIMEDANARTSENEQMPVSRLLAVARSLAATLAAVHRAGVLHRDVTPANVLITPDGTPLLIDYDLALIGDDGGEPAGGPVGTLGYLAPEQTGRTGLTVDRRADLYGLGATLYALAVGAPPFPGDDALELVRDTLVRIPVAPVERRPELPARLSEIVMRLLEKDPDRRYQSAEGLAYDLGRCAIDPDGGWELGERDFPAFLSAPGHLVGREPEVRLLSRALDRAAMGGNPAVLITGPPGIGKSALAHTLRALVTGRGGWFAAGRYDQHGAGTGSGGIARAVVAMTRLLLAEPETELAADRARITEVLGPNADLAASLIPEMAAFLGREGPAGVADPATTSARVGSLVPALFRAVAARHRLVVLLDDLQWASSTSLRTLDALIAMGPVPGLLVVLAYRELDRPVGRWVHEGLAEPPIVLTGLDRAGLAELAGAVLRADPPAVAGLAGLIEEGSAGNPYAAVELINALRAEGVLAPGDREGWAWDPAAVTAFVARHRVPELLAGRLRQQPEPVRRLLAVLACLGGDAHPDLLAAAADVGAGECAARTAPAIADGLIDAPDGGTVRFRHDLVHRAAGESLAPAERDRLRLAMARRLAGHDEFRQEAAEQYLAVAGLIRTPRERRAAADLLYAAARRAAQLTNYPAAERLLETAAGLLDRGAVRDAVDVERHATLYCLGRLDEADGLYRDLWERPLTRAGLSSATAIQINALALRGRTRDAITLGLEVLRRYGIQPPEDVPAHNHASAARLRDWVGGDTPPYPETETTDPMILQAGKLLNRMLAPTYLSDRTLHAWLVLEAHDLWLRYGVCAPLVGTLGGVICVTIDHGDDYRTGYLLTGHATATGRAHGYQAETAVCRYMHLLLAVHWFEPLEEVVEAAQQCRDELLAVGDVQVAGLLWARLLSVLLDTAESLDAVADEIPMALAFAERTGNRYAQLVILGYRNLVRVLRGTPDQRPSLDEVAALPPALATAHINHALVALFTGDEAALAASSTVAMEHSGAVRGFYVSALARLVRCLSDPSDQEARDWLARRAADAPRNFRPLLLLVDAERARHAGDPVTAARYFDEGLTEVAGRPWHHALLAERSARFHLGEGLHHAGRRLLGEARDAYRAWGATAVVARLEAEFPFLRATVSGTVSSESGTDRIDLMAILRASRALSSQTTLAGLEERVADVLSAMTGATHVHLALRREKESPWYYTAGPPLTAVRYVLRTGRPLLVADATRDDRFAGDPYLAGLDSCALLVLPMPSRTVESAVLVLANHHQRAVFSTDRLETVRLIAGQLAVSLDNALLYDSLESTVRSRTADLNASNDRLRAAHLELADRNRELESANRLKADLIGMLGHEINNPLAMILGYLDLALTEEDLPAPATELITKVYRNTQRLTGIVHEVLALVSIDAGRLVAAPRPVRLAGHLDTVLPDGTGSDCPPDLCVLVQPGHLDQILTNLISNAGKYGDGVTAIVVEVHEHTVTVEVRDEGPGVPPEFRDRLFGRLARAERTAAKVSGTGLGLYIVRELARANGGDVVYRPGPVRGSRFILSLPLASSSAYDLPGLPPGFLLDR
ncbi:AAA family ATPase [Actinoplanes sp. NPDC051851]|uniref:sensor histidine kinase n=1 Tax=Actinoplanes sp. NPDC051851 TaxID=3154753 RepID=UPI0034191F2C